MILDNQLGSSSLGKDYFSNSRAYFYDRINSSVVATWDRITLYSMQCVYITSSHRTCPSPLLPLCWQANRIIEPHMGLTSMNLNSSSTLWIHPNQKLHHFCGQFLTCNMDTVVIYFKNEIANGRLAQQGCPLWWTWRANDEANGTHQLKGSRKFCSLNN